MRWYRSQTLPAVQRALHWHCRQAAPFTIAKVHQACIFSLTATKQDYLELRPSVPSILRVPAAFNPGRLVKPPLNFIIAPLTLSPTLGWRFW